MTSLARRALRYEFTMWRSLFRWILRRPVAPVGATAFGYAATVTPLFLVFIAVSAIELPIAHMLLPWETARLVVDLASVYGLLWMFGMLANVRVHPHVVSASGLRIRHNSQVDVTIPWSAIASVRARNRGAQTRPAVQVDGDVANVVVLSQTNVDVVLNAAMTLDLPAGPVSVSQIRFYADDPHALIAQASDHVGQPPGEHDGRQVGVRRRDVGHH
jgi:hypothetical protein